MVNLQTCLEQNKSTERHEDQCLQSCCADHSPAWCCVLRIYRRHLRLIEHYHQRWLRTILNIHCSDFVTNIEVLGMAKFTSIEAMPLKTKHRWAGHVSGMEDHRLTKITIYGELATGHRDRGTPSKRYKDNVKRSIVTCKVNHRQWTTQATNRMNWGRTVYQATSSF